MKIIDTDSFESISIFFKNNKLCMVCKRPILCSISERWRHAITLNGYDCRGYKWCTRFSDYSCSGLLW